MVPILKSKKEIPMWLIVVAFILINIGLAKYDAYRIKNNIPINHTINAIVYTILILLFYKWLAPLKILGLLLIRIPIFNTSLNIFRGLPPNHLSSTTTSVIDKIINPIINKIGYWTYNIIVFVLSLFLIYL
jgi:hypothetical protein